MRCDVLLFAQARDLADGRDRVQLSLRDEASVRDAIDALMQQHPSMQPLRNRLAIALDEKYVSIDTPLRDGCTLALIPPVSGG